MNIVVFLLGTMEEEVLCYPEADPYMEEDRVFLEAVRSRDSSKIQSNYQDASKTYNLSWCVRRASETSI